MKNAENLVQQQKSDTLHRKTEHNPQELTAMPKRSKNPDNSYIEDANEKL